MTTGDTEKIPIVILHRDEASFLRQMVDSIRRNTLAPYQLLVVDNHSAMPESITLLSELEDTDTVVIRNQENRWVLGFNAALAHPLFNHRAPYFVFSDGDIVVPEVDIDGKCWLGRLIHLMNENACAGKIGLSLDLSRIADRTELQHIVENELGYSSGQRIGNLIIAPVDTTLAIYRKTTFVMDQFRFLPGHKSLIRPYLFSMRTTPDFSAVHLGWQDYGSLTKPVSEKIRCFARFGGHVDQVTLSMASPYDRIYYRIAAPVWRAFWSVALAYHWACYILRRFPRDLNELQAEARIPAGKK